MKEIRLDKGYVALMDDEDYEFLSRFNWSVMQGAGGKCYARADVFMHRLVANEQDRSKYVDHKDGDGLNNRRGNLRSCNQSQNAANSPCRKTKNRTSKYKGVCKSKATKKWVAQIHHMGKKKHLGCYDMESDAAAAYNYAAYKIYGEFAKLNEV